MKIGDEVYVHGYVDEIRNDCVIIRNDGGYFGTVEEEVICFKAKFHKEHIEPEVVIEPTDKPKVILPKMCKSCDSASKIIEAYSRGFKDGAEAVKAMPQTFVADGIVFARMDEPSGSEKPNNSKESER